MANIRGATFQFPCLVIICCISFCSPRLSCAPSLYCIFYSLCYLSHSLFIALCRHCSTLHGTWANCFNCIAVHTCAIELAGSGSSTQLPVLKLLFLTGTSCTVYVLSMASHCLQTSASSQAHHGTAQRDYGTSTVTSLLDHPANLALFAWKL
ncbi:hypothetical protein DFH29DRAFT_548772 [Suillus ampliporus]|nr:hypothetical protein DFH29DRAFT_548772 [Suillus ampliporus]